MDLNKLNDLGKALDIIAEHSTSIKIVGVFMFEAFCGFTKWFEANSTVGLVWNILKTVFVKLRGLIKGEK